MDLYFVFRLMNEMTNNHISHVSVFVLMLKVIAINGELIRVERQRNVMFQYNSILNITVPNWITCAQLCSRIYLCQSMNYISKEKTCQIFDRVPECPLQNSDGDSFLNRTLELENLAGNCENHTCGKHEMCIEKSIGYSCVVLLQSQKRKDLGLNCDFENGDTCSWRQTSNFKGDSFDWTLHQGETLSLDTGPPSDHTKGTSNGKYLYIEVTGQGNYQFAELLTDLLPKNSACLTIWYFMYGSDINKLEIGIKTNCGSFQSLTTLVGEQGYQWKEVKVTLNSASDFIIGIRAYRGTGFRGDIAIDDIVVSHGAC